MQQSPPERRQSPQLRRSKAVWRTVKLVLRKRDDGYVCQKNGKNVGLSGSPTFFLSLRGYIEEGLSYQIGAVPISLVRLYYSLWDDKICNGAVNKFLTSPKQSMNEPCFLLDQSVVQTKLSQPPLSLRLRTCRPFAAKAWSTSCSRVSIMPEVTKEAPSFI